MRAPARALVAQPRHEAADTSRAGARAAPVVVVRVVAARPVALGPQPLDEDERPPALEGARARFDALYRVRARDLRLVGVPDGRVEALDAGGEDGGGLE